MISALDSQTKKIGNVIITTREQTELRDSIHVSKWILLNYSSEKSTACMV